MWNWFPPQQLYFLNTVFSARTLFHIVEITDQDLNCTYLR